MFIFFAETLMLPEKLVTSNVALGWKKLRSAGEGAFGMMSISDARCAHEPTSKEHFCKQDKQQQS